MLNTFGMIAAAGLVIAILRQFDWDPFAAGAWAIDQAWTSLNHVADLWSSNDTFKHATRAPKN